MLTGAQALTVAVGPLWKVCGGVGPNFEVTSMVAVKRDVLGAVNARFDFGSPRPFDCGTARYAVRGAHRPQVKPGGQPPTSGRLGGDGSHRRALISRTKSVWFAAFAGLNHGVSSWSV